MSAPAAETTTEKRASSRNPVGIIALVTALVGAIFACLPGVLIIGWVLLPIAFILSLVSLFLKGKKRGTGVCALIVSVVGTVIGIIVFFAVVADAFDEAFSDETTAGVPSDANAEDSDEQGDPESESAAGEDEAEGAESPAEDEDLGTRTHPYPPGTEISSSDWTVSINSVDLEADAAIAAENQFNEEPEEGHTYILVNVTAEYIGDDAEGVMPMASISYVSPQGNTFNSYDMSVVEPDAFNSLTTLYEGASETGNIAIHVPSEDIEDGVLSVAPDMFADTVFVAVN